MLFKKKEKSEEELKKEAKELEEKLKKYPLRIENLPSHISITNEKIVEVTENNKKIKKIEEDSTLTRTIYAHGYPRNVETGFLDKIVSALGNFDLSMHIDPYDIETMMVFLNKELQKQRSDLYAAKLKNIINPSLEIKYKDTKGVLTNLQKGKDKLFNVSMYINCRAKTKEELDLLTKRIYAELNSLWIIPKQP